MPVGSAEPHLDRGSIWGSLDKECLEELNLTNAEYTSSELVAKTLELMPAKGGWHYLVFRTKIQMTSDHVIKHWETAVDKKEHRHLEAFSDEPDELLYELRARLWDVYKADPTSLAKTTQDNHGKFLPQGVLGILSSYVQQQGFEFATRAEEYFGRHFDLTSCFEK